MFSNWHQKRSWTCRKLNSDQSVSDRQERINGWDQEALSNSVGLLIGAGGIGSEVGFALVRKGVGTLHIADFDVVSPSNLNRQFFADKDLYKNKAIQLSKNLASQGYLGTRLVAHPSSSSDLDIRAINPDFIVCGIDNQIEGARFEISREAHLLGKHCIFVATNIEADFGYCFAQEVLTPKSWT